MNAVETRGIKKYFGSGETRVEALRETDFDARFGELTFVVGPSGSGKTTLLSVVAGLLDHDEGSLHVLDADMGALSNAERLSFRRQNIGFLFQQYNLLPALNAVENVAVPLIANGIPRKTAEERAAALLKTVGLEARMLALPSELSGAKRPPRPRRRPHQSFSAPSPRSGSSNRAARTFASARIYRASSMRCRCARVMKWPPTRRFSDWRRGICARRSQMQTLRSTSRE